MISGLVAAFVRSAQAHTAIRYWGTTIAILLLLLALSRSGKPLGRFNERIENRKMADDVQRQMLEAMARRARNEFSERLRYGQF